MSCTQFGADINLYGFFWFYLFYFLFLAYHNKPRKINFTYLNPKNCQRPNHLG